MLRDVPIGWGWEVYIEMFLAGIAAGAYLTAMLLELMGRGRSPIARTAHVIALPLVLVATALLVMKLERPERFWHMVIQSEFIPLPMVKWWAPISAGTWGLMAFTAFAAVSFVDALISRDWFWLGPWRSHRTLHGSLLGKVWAIGGIAIALFVGAYSGALLSITALRGWVDTMFISPLFLAISVTTGTAFLLLVNAVRRRAPLDEVAGLERFNLLVMLWQLLLFVVFLVSLGGAISFFLTSTRTIAAIIGGVLLGILVPLLLHFGPLRADPLRNGLIGVAILVGGFLLRYFIVMGPQHAIE